MKEAYLYREAGGGRVECYLCAHHCKIADGGLGVCGVRKNIAGKLYSLNYRKLAASHTDPIEKKPLYHFLPGSSSHSVAAMGCNFSCPFCQNSSLAVVEDEGQIYGRDTTPGEIVETALASGCRSISYTYSEPTVYFELLLDTAKLAKEHGLKNVMVTNGYMTREALETVAPYLDAANVDVKAFSEKFYKERCKARLLPVLETVEQMWHDGIWVEVTTLLIPGLNTDPGEIKNLIAFILGIDENIPWHVSRFFPQHRLLDVPPTPVDIVFSALETGKKMGLKYLYAGNVGSGDWSDTDCGACGASLVERSGYRTRLNRLSGGNCGNCGNPIAGVWQ